MEKKFAAKYIKNYMYSKQRASKWDSKDSILLSLLQLTPRFEVEKFVLEPAHAS